MLPLQDWKNDEIFTWEQVRFLLVSPAGGTHQGEWMMGLFQPCITKATGELTGRQALSLVSSTFSNDISSETIGLIEIKFYVDSIG